MGRWIKQGDVMEEPFEIKKVSGPSQSLIDPIALMDSKEAIGRLIFEEKDFDTAKKLEAIYKDMNIVINKSL
jgi:hypothetical protein